MKTQIHIRKTNKWAFLFIVLMALSASLNAQHGKRGVYNKEMAPAVEQAWKSLDQLSESTEKHLSYKAASFSEESPRARFPEEASAKTDHNPTVLLVESTQERKDELKSNPRSLKDVVQVGYFHESKNTAIYKVRNIFTKKPALNCNLCTRVVSTPYVVYMKPRVK